MKLTFYPRTMNSVHNTSQAHCNIPPQESLKVDVKWIFVIKMELS